ncbi:hypothetical protein [Nocardiopsis sp. FR26]
MPSRRMSAGLHHDQATATLGTLTTSSALGRITEPSSIAARSSV